MIKLSSLLQRNTPLATPELGYTPNAPLAEVARGARIIAAGYAIGAGFWAAAYEAFRYSVEADVATTAHGATAAAAGILLTGAGLVCGLSGYETGRDMIADAVE